MHLMIKQFKKWKFSKNREVIGHVIAAFLVMYAALINTVYSTAIAIAYLIGLSLWKSRKIKDQNVRWLVYFVIVIMLINMTLAWFIKNL